MSKGAAALLTLLMLAMMFSGCIEPVTDAPGIGDVTPPGIELLSPKNLSFIEPGTPIRLSIIDDGPLSSVSFSVDGSSYEKLYSPFEVSTDSWGEGEHRLDITASDGNENKGNEFFIFYIDLSPPVIELLFPSNGSALESSSKILFSIEDESPIGVNYSLDGGGARILPHPFSISVAWWTEGEHHIQVNAIDMAGNRASSRYTFIIDNMPTGIEIISPAFRVIQPGTPIVFDVDEDNLIDLTCVVNGDTVDFSSQIIDTSEWTDGQYFIVINATDLAGHEISRSFLFEVDSAPPSLRSSIPDGSVLKMNGTLDYLNNSFSSDGGIISIYPEDEHLLMVQASVNGEGYRRLEAPYNLNLYGVRGNLTELSMKAVDVAGNVGYLNLSLVPEYLIKILLPEGTPMIAAPFTLYDRYIRHVFEDINGSYDKVSSFVNGSWLTFKPAYPDKYSDIKYIKTDMAYLVSVNRSSAVLSLSGSLAGSDSIHLRRGSNMVPYLSVEPLAVRDALGDLPYYSVERWDAEKIAYVEMGPYDLLLPGESYWIYMNHDATLTFDF